MVYFTVGIPKEAGGMFENPKLIRNGNKYPKRKGDPDGVQMHFSELRSLGLIYLQYACCRGSQYMQIQHKIQFLVTHTLYSLQQLLTA